MTNRLTDRFPQTGSIGTVCGKALSEDPNQFAVCLGSPVTTTRAFGRPVLLLQVAESRCLATVTRPSSRHRSVGWQRVLRLTDKTVAFPHTRGGEPR
jgi:hypothetical protein